jgi:hypothetical protein
MVANIVTVEDLQKFKEELLADIRKLISKELTVPARKWLKSTEVRKMLPISPGTLQNLRVNGNLPFIKIGKVIFYDYEDVLKMIEQNRRSTHPAGKKAKPILS